MKKIFTTLLQLTLVLTAIIVFTHLNVVFAEQNLPLSTETVQTYKKGQLPGPNPSEMENFDTIDEIEDLVFDNLYGYVKVIVAVLGILFITIMGSRMVFSGDEEDTITKMRRGITYAIIAFVIVSMAEEASKIFDMGEKSIFESPQEILRRVKLFDSTVELVMTFIKYVIGAFATIMAVKSGLKLASAGGDDEQVGQNKKGLLYSASGLVLILIGDIFINKVFYKVDKTVYTNLEGIKLGTDPYEGVRQIVGITNFIVSFVGPVSVLMLVIAAVMYMTAGGEDEKMETAKKMLVATIIGMVIIFGAFALVNTFLSGSLPISE